jgi:hypothetical protein
MPAVAFAVFPFSTLDCYFSISTSSASMVTKCDRHIRRSQLFSGKATDWSCSEQVRCLLIYKELLLPMAQTGHNTLYPCTSARTRRESLRLDCYWDSAVLACLCIACMHTVLSGLFHEVGLEACPSVGSVLGMLSAVSACYFPM